MIHFFRRIRRALLEDNRFRKYVVYALGEIALVMIGILLALQVNNWNENRKNIATKNVQCLELLASLDNDLIEIDNYNERLRILEEEGQYLWEVVNGRRNVQDTNYFKSCFLNAANLFAFTPNNTVYDNLVQSGGLSLIKSDSIKNLFGLYYTDIKGALESDKQRIEYTTAYNDLRFEFASPMMLKKYLSQVFSTKLKLVEFSSRDIIVENNNVIDADLSEFDLDWDDLINSKIYKTYLGRMLAIREPIISNTARTINRIKIMKSLLREEIK